MLSSVSVRVLFSAICTKKVDICFVVDQSGSIVEKDPGNWQLVKNFIYNIIENFDIGYDETRVALVTFANKGIVRWDLAQYFNKAAIRKALDDIPAGNGWTNTYDGFNRMRTEVFNTDNDRPGVQNVAIVITDGKATLNTNLTIPEATRSHDQGIKVFAVGVTDGVNEDELKAISSPPQEINRNYWKTPDFGDLTTLVGSLQTETCNDFLNQG